MGVLKGLRVLDLTRVLAGPYCTQILADLGADVVKVERPGTGDDTRAWAPPFALDAEGRETRTSTYFQCANRGKRSITADLSHARGCALVSRLAGCADVLVENFKPGDLARRGLDHAILRARHPRLVFCSITGYGQTGPYAQRPGYDPIAQALGGMMSVTGEADHLPGGGPQRCGVAVVDTTTGIYAALAILAALRHRDATGEGQHIDMALLDVQVSLMINVAQAWLGAGEVGKRIGSGHPSVVPSQGFRAADGYLMLNVGNDAQFAAFCTAAGRSELCADARFTTNEARVRNREVVIPVVAGIVALHPRVHWVEKLNAAGVPCAPVNDMAAAFDDPQVRARGLRVELPSGADGPVAVVASPLRLSGAPPEYRRAPPALGAHTGEVLAEWLGIGADELADLRSAGAV
jgi:crotonobetainyl-CoA:carnitine CoA-transferase CaiB-like acyl-CoA transferase